MLSGVFNLFIWMFCFIAVFDNDDKYRVCTLNALTRHSPFKSNCLFIFLLLHYNLCVQITSEYLMQQIEVDLNKQLSSIPCGDL